MDTNTHELLLKEEVFQVVGCAMEVLNTLGHGLLEKPYENAMAVEFRQKGIPFQQQPRFPVIYKSVNVGEYIPDLIAFDSLIVDTKVIAAIGNNEKAQIINYLKITGLRVGLILNFKHAKLEWQRIVL
ncbi:GxxExxY protein [Luteolibacter algae]|uniref:GxxExxY protein n=1 Tax=Luteolibacter algae TaxID=454151 RepID=A0ABW5D2W5_9BACT